MQWSSSSMTASYTIHSTIRSSTNLKQLENLGKTIVNSTIRMFWDSTSHMSGSITSFKKRKLKDKELSFFYGDSVHHVTWADSINNVLAFDYLAEYGVNAV